MNLDQDEARIVHYSRFFNKTLTALAPIRRNQDSGLVDILREDALNKMGGAPNLSDNKLFYIGSIDYMVVDSGGRHEFVVLESNGGSSRGLLSLSEDQVIRIYKAFKSAIDQSTEDTKKFVLIGHMATNDLLQEKILLIEFLKEQYREAGLTLEFYNTRDYNPLRKGKEDITVVLSSYDELAQFIGYENQYLTFKGEQVNVAIGDGIARRFPKISPGIKQDWKAVKTSIVNPIYHVTDDKFNTYVAVSLGGDILEKFRIQQLKFGKVFNRAELTAALENLIETEHKNYIIKPFGGSGGAGIQPVLKDMQKRGIPEIIDKSIEEFHQKFDPGRDPFPYTIQEMANFVLIDWRGQKRTFDIRMYIAQQEGKIIPVGGEARIARADFTGAFKKSEFVVNICGDWGVEFERAVGFTNDNLKRLNLSRDDVIDMFCGACKLFQIITEKREKILSFNAWTEFLK